MEIRQEVNLQCNRIIACLGEAGVKGVLGWYVSSLTKTVLATAPWKAWPGQPRGRGSSRDQRGSDRTCPLVAPSLSTGPLACGWSSLPFSEPRAVLRGRNAELLFYPLLREECLQAHGKAGRKDAHKAPGICALSKHADTWFFFGCDMRHVGS